MLGKFMAAFASLILVLPAIADEGVSREHLITKVADTYRVPSTQPGVPKPCADATLRAFRAELSSCADKRLPTTLPAASALILKYGLPADRRLLFSDPEYLRLKAREAVEYVIPASKGLERIPLPSSANLEGIAAIFSDFEPIAVGALGEKPEQGRVDAVKRLIRWTRDQVVGEAADPYATFGKRSLTEAQRRQIGDGLSTQFAQMLSSDGTGRERNDAMSACRAVLASLRKDLRMLTTDDSLKAFGRTLRTPELDAAVRDLEACEARLRAKKP